MNGSSVESTQGVAARERPVASPTSASGEHGRLIPNEIEVPAWRAAVRKRRRDGKPEFILHPEKWR